jgi:hypothetical protein
MIRDTLIVVSIITMAVTMFVVIVMFAPRHGVVVINCGIAEISPDYTPAMKEECRRARAGLKT